MADRAHRLEPAIQVARSREDEAARTFAEAQHRLVDQEAQLHQLLTFRREYAEQFQNAGRTGLLAHQLHNYTAFLANLDRSITQSRQQSECLQGECQRQHEHWLHKRARTQALQTVIEGYRREQGRIEEHREQAATDERALRGCWQMAED